MHRLGATSLQSKRVFFMGHSVELFCFEEAEYPYIENAIICEMRKN